MGFVKDYWFHDYYLFDDMLGGQTAAECCPDPPQIDRQVRLSDLLRHVHRARRARQAVGHIA